MYDPSETLNQYQTVNVHGRCPSTRIFWLLPLQSDTVKNELNLINAMMVLIQNFEELYKTKLHTSQSRNIQSSIKWLTVSFPNIGSYCF